MQTCQSSLVINTKDTYNFFVKMANAALCSPESIDVKLTPFGFLPAFWCMNCHCTGERLKICPLPSFQSIKHRNSTLLSWIAGNLFVNKPKGILGNDAKNDDES